MNSAPDTPPAPGGPGPVLLIGAGGMLARAILGELRGRGVETAITGHRELDIRDEQRVQRALHPGVRTVLNCAGWTDVDGAETDEAGAMELNARAVGRLARRCAQIGAVLVNYGTDYIFDGRAASPYAIGHPRAPLGAYGRSKAAGEEELGRAGAEHLHIRTSWLYAPWGTNFVRTMHRLLRERERVRVVDDQRGRPTSAEHLARTTLALLGRGARGTWHATDGGECTWYGFAVEIKRLTGAAARVEPCTSAEFPRPAERPAYSVLDLSGTEALLGPMPDWKENLADVVRRLE